MIEKTVIVITDGMTDEEIFTAINEQPHPLIADMRTLVDKLIEQIIREQYGKDNSSSVSEGNNRPGAITITED